MTEQVKALPKHIAMIMDGNGRWAKNLGKERSYGHNRGVETVIDIVEYCRQINIQYLTLYTFSSENWKRPKSEVDFIMGLIIQYIETELPKLIENGVKLVILGEQKDLPDETLEAINKAIDSTKNNKDMRLNIALNYGGRDEILKACREIASLVKEGRLSIDDIDDNLFKSHLYTCDQPDPDLIIRTGSEQRLSNFLTYQSVYSEIYFTDELWPDFNRNSLDSAIEDYKSRNRRYGGLDG